MNQGKLEVVKQKMARVNVDILGTSELKWTGMVNLTHMTIISTTVGRNPSVEMEYATVKTQHSQREMKLKRHKQQGPTTQHRN